MRVNSSNQYGSPAKFLHWTMAIVIFGMLYMGFTMTDLPLEPDKLKLYGLHKSIGSLILGAVILRLLVRLMNITPRLPEHMSCFQKFGAHASHWLLYALMFAMPLSGWVMSNAAGFPVSVFGWFLLPQIVVPDVQLRVLAASAHEIFAVGLILLVGLHALAAAIHHFYFKDGIFKRMWPNGNPEG